MYFDNYNFDDNKNDNFGIKNLNLKQKLILGGVLFVVIIIIMIVINNVSNYFNSYSYFEKRMIKVAKEYVSDNTIGITDEIYLDVLKLNIDMKDGCNEIS